MSFLQQLILGYYNNDEFPLDEEKAIKLDEFFSGFSTFMRKYSLPSCLLDLSLNSEVEVNISEFSERYTIKKEVEEAFDSNNTSLVLSMFLAEDNPQEYKLEIRYYISRDGEIVIDSVDFNYGSYMNCKKIGTMND